MSKALIDTTVLVNGLMKSKDISNRMKSAMEKFDQTRLPAYALKEYREGPLQAHVWLYNKLVLFNSLNIAYASIQSIRRHKNKQSTAQEALTLADTSIASKLGTGGNFVKKYGARASIEQVRTDEIKFFLQKKIIQSWENRRKFTTIVDKELDCFPERKPKLKKQGIYDLSPNKCSNPENCCLAKEMAKDPDAINKMREALKPVLKDKQENQKRSKALKKLTNRSLNTFTHNECKSLGDAAFAFYCKKDEVILTTNIIDHRILATSLGKRAVDPTAPRLTDAYKKVAA
ncbi:MAG TPA: hypothetical protein PK583_04765 [Gammaproteobacteria bacterium]|nr:hypothetical protein [Gammaproteobacteria bacterium]HQX27544.1 hypothetical protein [Alphaproteobacteria bacterium]